MNYIKIFTDFAQSLEPLGDAERGRLFTAMLEYAAQGAEPEFRGNERFVWPTAKSKIDRDIGVYNTMCQRNARNRNVGLTSGDQSSPVVTDGDGTSKTKTKTKTPPIAPPGFDAFWTAYPKKVGKGAAQKAFEKLCPDQPMLDEMLCAIQTQKRCEQWCKEGGQYIPYPATWLTQRRWEDETEAQEVSEQWL